MASTASYNEMPSDNDKSAEEDAPKNDSKINSESAESSRESSHDSLLEYSESSILSSGKEFGPETTRPNVVDDMVERPVTWVPTFKERIGTAIGRLLNDLQKFFINGKMAAPPIISISMTKVQKCISFPLYEDQLDTVISAFEQSAFGRGSETVVDTSFCNSWELSRNDFEIMNTEWDSYLVDKLRPLIQRDLRLEVGFQLNLYKLLLYKTGSFFKQHRDSEKDVGMFGTVIIQLPSVYEGGKLIVRHNQQTDSAFSTRYSTAIVSMRFCQ